MPSIAHIRKACEPFKATLEKFGLAVSFKMNQNKVGSRKIESGVMWDISHGEKKISVEWLANHKPIKQPWQMSGEITQMKRQTREMLREKGFPCQLTGEKHGVFSASSEHVDKHVESAYVALIEYYQVLLYKSRGSKVWKARVLHKPEWSNILNSVQSEKLTEVKKHLIKNGILPYTRTEERLGAALTKKLSEKIDIESYQTGLTGLFSPEIVKSFGLDAGKDKDVAGEITWRKNESMSKVLVPEPKTPNPKTQVILDFTTEIQIIRSMHSQVQEKSFDDSVPQMAKDYCQVGSDLIEKGLSYFHRAEAYNNFNEEE